MQTRKLPTRKRLHELFKYDEVTGNLIRKISTSPNARVGDIAGYINNSGYVFVSADSAQYLGHRIIWKMQNGDMPVEMDIDHIDGDRKNNILDNLRTVSRRENSLNRKMTKFNTSGCVGVYWHKDRGKWCAGIMVKQKHLYLGIFSRKEEAIQVRKEAEVLHGFHLNHGTK